MITAQAVLGLVEPQSSGIGGGARLAKSGKSSMRGLEGRSRSAFSRCFRIEPARAITPAGRPASWAMSASSDAVSGAHSGGLRTTQLPAASAGPMRHVASMRGAFHGVMMATTPAGSYVMRSRWPRPGTVMSGWARSFSR